MRVNFFCVFIALLILNIPVHAQWTELNNGLVGGPSSHFEYHNDTLYVGSFGGMYRSVDEGLTWERINDGFTDASAVNDVTQCGEKIFAATNGGELVYRLNAASEWIPTNNGLPAYAIITLIALSNTLVGLTNQGTLHMSQDLGASWQEISTPYGRISGLATDGTKLFVSTSTGIKASVDFGANWTNSGLTGTRIIDLDGSENYLICWADNGVFVSTNAGLSWQIQGFVRDYYDINSKGSMVLASSFQASYLSTNGGLSWVRITQLEKVANAIFINGKIITATYYGVYQSSNAGGSWQATNTGLKNNLVYEIIHHSGYLFVASISGIYRSDNKGQLWTKCTAGLPFVGIASAIISKDDRLLAAMPEHGLYTSTDNGNTWAKVTSVNNVSKIINHDGQLLASGYEGIYKSTDGVNWSRYSATAVSGNLISAQGKVWVCRYEGVFNTSDGTNWTSVSSGLSPTIWPYRLKAFGDHLFLGTLNRAVFKAENFEEPWVSSSNGISLNGVRSFASKDSLLITGCISGVYMSIDTAKSWTNISDNLPIYWITGSIESLAVYNRKLLAGVSFFGLWMWTPCFKPPAPSITVNKDDCPIIEFNSSQSVGNEWYVDGIPIPGATEGTYTTQTPGVYTVLAEDEGCKSEMSEPVDLTYAAPKIVMPNVLTPNGDSKNENFVPMQMEGAQAASLSVFDRWGKTVYTTTDITTGWNGAGYPTGVYYYSVSYLDDCLNKQLVKGWLHLVR